MAIDPVSSSPSVRLAATDSAALARLADGATLEAKVVARLPNGVARLQIDGAVIEAKAPPSLTAGMTVGLTVSRTPDGVKLLLAAPLGGAQVTPTMPQSSPSVTPAQTLLGPSSRGGSDGVARGAIDLTAPTAMQVRPPSFGAGAGGATGQVAPVPNSPVPPGGMVDGRANTARPIETQAGASPAGSTTLARASSIPGAMPAGTISTPTMAAAAAGGAAHLPGTLGQSAASPGAAGGVGATTPSAENAGAPKAALATDTAAPSMPSTRPILNATVHQALARQNDLAPVMNLAAQVLASPAALAKLPVEAQRLMQMLLGLKIEAPTSGNSKSKAGLNAEALKAVVAASGVFLEQCLARGKPPGPQGDLKALLLSLSGLLAKGEGEPAPTQERPAPPIRRDEPDARGVGRPVALDPPQALKQLSEAANAALDRVRLLQYASLDGAVDGAPARQDPQPGQAREVMFELPFQIGRETHVVPFRVSREAPERREGEAASQPVWKLSFAIAVEPIGPVHARLMLRGERLDVRLYAERPEVAARMAAASGELRQALGHDGLIDLDGVTVEPGRPGSTANGVERRA